MHSSLVNHSIINLRSLQCKYFFQYIKLFHLCQQTLPNSRKKIQPLWKNRIHLGILYDRSVQKSSQEGGMGDNNRYYLVMHTQLHLRAFVLVLSICETCERLQPSSRTTTEEWYRHQMRRARLRAKAPKRRQRTGTVPRKNRKNSKRFG